MSNGTTASSDRLNPIFLTRLASVDSPTIYQHGFPCHILGDLLSPRNRCKFHFARL